MIQTKRLPKAYFESGVEEYWIADARGDELIFAIYQRGDDQFELAESSADGFQKSNLMNAWFQLTRPVVEPEWIEFELRVRRTPYWFVKANF